MTTSRRLGYLIVITPTVPNWMECLRHKDIIKADRYLLHLPQFWIVMVVPLGALLESLEAGELTPEKVVSTILATLYLIGNVINKKDRRS